MVNKDIHIPLALECSACMIDNLGVLIPLLTKDTDKQYSLYRIGYELLAKGYEKRLDPATLSIGIYRKLYTECQEYDPYRSMKDISVNAAKKALPIIESSLATKSGFQKFWTTLAAAITGNILDFNTAGHNPDLEQLGDTFNAIIQQGFIIDHSQSLWDTLNSKKGRISFLADNAGETLFDIPLVRLLTETGWNVTYIVKEQPMINDAVIDDVLDTEIINYAEIATTGAWAFGTPKKDVSKEFLGLIRKSNLIISKGQANIETFPEIQREMMVETYYILRAKCEHIAKRLGVEKGDNVVLKRPCQ